jgi:hypothetical protein
VDGSKSNDMGVPHALNGITEDDLLVRVPFRVIVSSVVNEFHLLENRGFPRLAGAEEEHLDFILCHEAITLELGLDFVIA